MTTPHEVPSEGRCKPPRTLREPSGDSPQPRPLTQSDLTPLIRHGLLSPQQAARELAPTCPDCGLSVLSRTHDATCGPEQAEAQPRQPWEPRKAA